jgi:hypothetical protein
MKLLPQAAVDIFSMPERITIGALQALGSETFELEHLVK